MKVWFEIIVFSLLLAFLIVVEFRYKSNGTNMSGKKVFFTNRKNCTDKETSPTSSDEDTFFIGNQKTNGKIIIEIQNTKIAFICRLDWGHHQTFVF